MSVTDCLGHLDALVACDTQNPPRAIDGDSAIFRYCSEVVGSDFRVELHDHGLCRGVVTARGRCLQPFVAERFELEAADPFQVLIEDNVRS